MHANSGRSKNSGEAFEVRLMSALSGLKVVDFSESVAGQYCSRLMSGYGAEVVLVEPAGGSSIRRLGPFSKIHGDSLAFFHLNIDKRSVLLDLETDAKGEKKGIEMP